MAIKGQNLRVMLGGSCVAAATSCTFHVAASVEESSTKDDTNDWSSSEVTGKSWDASTDALVLLTDTGGKTAVDILSLIGTTVTLTFDQTSGDKNRTAASSAIKKTGTAIVADVSISAQNRQNATYTVQFTGTGALA